MSAPFARFAARLLAAARARAATRQVPPPVKPVPLWRNAAWLWPDLFKADSFKADPFKADSFKD